MPDQRARKVAFIAHCLLNQNAKVDTMAQRPAMVESLLEVLRDCHVGVIQMPCPECRHFGLERPMGEDTREQYDVPAYVECCSVLAGAIAADMSEYLNCGYRVPFVLGVEGSPSCSVERVPTRAGLVQGRGLFIEALVEALDRERIEVAVIGVPETGDLAAVLSDLQVRATKACFRGCRR